MVIWPAPALDAIRADAKGADNSREAVVNVLQGILINLY